MMQSWKQNIMKKLAQKWIQPKLDVKVDATKLDAKVVVTPNAKPDAKVAVKMDA